MSEQPNFLLRIINFLSRISLILVSVVLAIGLVLAWPLIFNHDTPTYASDEDHFKYASVGGESVRGIPIWLWKVLPVAFADKLPGGEASYASLGFITEPGYDLPIGFAKGTANGLEMVTQTCAACHTGVYRESADSEPQIVAGMPANTVDFAGYLKFVTDVAADPRFNANYIMAQIEAIGGTLSPAEKFLYRNVVIPTFRELNIATGSNLAYTDRQPVYGPGRVDTFSFYKTEYFHFPPEKFKDYELAGIADYPSIWWQGPRKGMDLHWDGNNSSLKERNSSASLALASPPTLDFASVERTANWLLDFPAPEYPFPINEELAAKGEQLFENNCAVCHAWDGEKVGTVTPIEEIGTDRGRLDSYTYEFASNQYSLYTGITNHRGEDMRFTHFRKTDGYSNPPLDGIWLRAPYLHNGSVPTLRDLLEKPEDRPQVFYRGNTVFDKEKVGFVADVAAEGGRPYFKYDTTLDGNHNSGHLYGTDLLPQEKDALVEYMKTINGPETEAYGQYAVGDSGDFDEQG